MSISTVVPEEEGVIGTMREAVEVRAAVYGWLAVLFNGPPTEAVLALLEEPAFRGVVDEVAGAEVGETLAAAAREAELDALRWEYNNLFYVPAGQYLTPYESVYRGRHMEEGKERLGLLNGTETQEVLHLYHALEVEPQGARTTLPDFAGVEVEFLHLLVGQEAKAWEDDDRVSVRRLLDCERTFLLDHVVRWLPELCGNMAALAAQPLYAAVARFARAFLAMEEATFRDLPPLAGEGCPDPEG